MILFLLGQHISLMPDWTVLPQFIIFVIVLVILSVFVFKPMIKIFDRRRSQTIELQQQAGNFIAETEVLELEYKEQMNLAKAKGSKLEQEIISAGEEKARQIISGARQESNALLSRHRTKIHAEAELARQDIASKAGGFAQMIVDKILGRVVN